MTEDWRLKAACRGVDTELFFDEQLHPVLRDEYCKPCPVRHECRMEAVEFGDHKHGIRGGWLPDSPGWGYDRYQPEGRARADALSARQEAEKLILRGITPQHGGDAVRRAAKGFYRDLMAKPMNARWGVKSGRHLRIEKSGEGWAISTTPDRRIVMVVFKNVKGHPNWRFFKRQDVVYDGDPPAVLEKFPTTKGY